MDLMEIDIQAISPAPRQTYYSADPDLGLATARTLNDEIADIVGARPVCSVSAGSPSVAAPRAERSPAWTSERNVPGGEGCDR
jgi:hypothetical protein